MRRNNKSKDADKGKDKDETLDTSDLLIESLTRKLYASALLPEGRRSSDIEKSNHSAGTLE